jgi:hypothetical protein
VKLAGLPGAPIGLVLTSLGRPSFFWLRPLWLFFRAIFTPSLALPPDEGLNSAAASETAAAGLVVVAGRMVLVDQEHQRSHRRVLLR